MNLFRSLPVSIGIVLLALPALAISLFPDTPTSWPVGDNPRGIDMGDVNGDGWVDIVVVNTDGDTYTVLINDGSGEFPNTITEYARDEEPRDVVLAQLDGVGQVDMVIPCTGDTDWGFTEFFLNSGFGFTHHQAISTGAGPWHCVAGEFDGEQGLDVIVTCPWSYELITFHNDGLGNFSATSSYVGTPKPGGIDKADIDGDGDLDVIFTSNDTDDYRLSWARNDGTGSFTKVWGVSLVAIPMAVAAADYNGDGLVDIAVGQHNPPGVDNVRLYFGREQGGFDAPMMIGDLSHAVQLQAADMDADGDMDLICTELYNSQVTLLYNDGQGDFPQRENLSTMLGPYGLVIGDLNSDQALDIAITATGDDMMQVFLSTYPTTVPVAAVPATGIRGCYPNPFNPTGRIDLVLAQEAEVTVDIHGIDGRRVIGLHQGTLPRGEHVFDWNGRDEAGRKLPGGVYLVSLRGPGIADTEKMVLVK
jgi:hypothetical protein